MISAKEVKDYVFSLGADLCGIASIDRFDNAPKGYHPSDVLPTCKSVISFACQFPTATIRCNSNIPYTRVRNSITDKIDSISLDICITMGRHGICCIPVPANESVMDCNTSRWRSIVSQKHAAQASGLGTIGRHSLLITPEFGSMVWLGCVLCESELTPDRMKQPMCNHCNLCVDRCPVHALQNVEMNQQACWDFAFGNNDKTQTWEISCHKCRDICPFNFGKNNSL